MSKTLSELKAEAEAADRAYREAVGSGEARLNEIARQQDAGIRPEYHREDARDEHGNPIKLDRFGNPEWRTGQKINANRARPVYNAPLRSPHSEPGSPPPDIDFKGTGTWEQTKELWLDLVDAINAIEKEKLSQEERETYVQQVVPSILDRLAAVVPRVDCAFADSPMSKGAWIYLVGRYQTAFNPSKSLERSIGTMRSRTVPKFMSFALEGAKWLFRRCPSGIPTIKEEPVTEDHGDSSPNDGSPPDAPPRKRGRPKRIPEANV